MKIKAGVVVKHSFIHIFMIIVCIIAITPVLYTISVALNPNNSLISTKFSLIPQGATFENFKTILLDMPFITWFRNSLILALSTVAFSFIIGIPAAYSYSRFKFKGNNIHLLILLLLNAFPSILSMTAIYRLFRMLNMIDSFGGLILVYTGSMLIFTIWNLKGYFDSIPKQIEEAAMIDGASRLYILIKIILPLAVPSIIVTGMMIFITTWNEYIYAVNFLPSVNKYSLAAGLYSLQGTDYTRNWPVFAAGALITSVPILIIYFAIQRYMVSGLTAGGVKDE